MMPTTDRQTSAPWLRYWGVAALLAILAAPAVVRAQSGAPLDGAQIRAAFSGKTLQIRTEKITTGSPAKPTGTVRRSDGSHIVFHLVLRPDNSLIFRCTFYDRQGRPGACSRPGAQTRDVGVWSVEGSAFCYQWLTARSSLKQCHAVLREGERYRLRQLSGPPALIDGEIVEVK